MRVLGSGGMASVYEVIDQSTHKRLALKRLHPTTDPLRKRRVLELFEREFYTLSQITHPCVVEVYDYGVDDQGAYYTMELLQGGELQGLAPLPFERVCRIGRDICSALSLLHSRRLLYRDLNPRNVLCTSAGVSKLIDFGATTTMGPCQQVVATPAYCAPEAIDLQPLDARTDLYSLGATLYFALTGQHAFPAKSFVQLREFWDGPPLRPGEIASDVPPALDSLIMDLLNLDPFARPANAGELMEQLAAIEGLPGDERQHVELAYLSTPNLVGRETQLAQVRAKLIRAVRGQGSSLLFTGASGVGRSRLLAACLLEAKLLGALVLRATPSEADGDFGVLRALGAALLEVAPELIERVQPQWQALLHMLPELDSSREAQSQVLAVRPQVERTELLATVLDWIGAVALQRPLLIAIDDFQRVDEPSAACVAWIARAAHDHRLLVAVACEDEAKVHAAAALKLFESGAQRMPVTSLSPAQTEDLLRSVFGSVPHVQRVAHELHAIAAGNPRDTLQLAQFLIDRHVVRYRSGAWSLPASFEDGDLPGTMAQAMRREFEALDPLARNLGRLLSLAKDRALSFDECVSVQLDVPAKQVGESLQALVRAQMLERDVNSFAVAHRGLHATLQTGISPEQLQVAHRQLAEIFGRRSHEEFRHAKHLLLAGDAMAAVDVLVPFSTLSLQRTDTDPKAYLQLVHSMPDDWLEVFERAIAACETLQRPRADAFHLRARLGSLLNVLGAPLAACHRHVIALLCQLTADSGLDHYATLDPSLEPQVRLQQALAAANARYAESSEQTRGIEPRAAVRFLIRAELLAVGIIAIAIDYRFWAALPSITAFRPLSPAIGLIEQVISAVAARITGRHEYARSAYHELIARMEQPDMAGLDPSNHRFLRYGVMYGLAMLEAGMGLESSLRWAQALKSEPLFAVNALYVEMLYHLWLGQTREAERIREQVELRRIESDTRQLADGTYLIWQTVAHAYSDDLTHTKQVIESLRTLAQRLPSWLPVVEYATGEYHRIRGDLASAAEHLRASLQDIESGTHQIWPHATGAYIGVLVALGRIGEATAIGTSYLEAAERAGLGYVINYIRMPLAVALARSKEIARATSMADRAIADFDALQTRGLNLVLAYEARSRVAIEAKHSEDYAYFAERCAEQCERAGSGTLRAKRDRLLRAANNNRLPVPAGAAPQVFTSLLETMLKTAFKGCDQPAERAQRSLQMLLRRSGAQEGSLFLVGNHGPQLAAKVGDREDVIGMLATINEFIDTELEDSGMDTASVETVAAAADTRMMLTQIHQYRLVMLSHQTLDGIAITGVAALLTAPTSPFVHPGSLASRLSRLIADSGDVIPLTED
jgi:hypothetical protein